MNSMFKNKFVTVGMKFTISSMAIISLFFLSGSWNVQAEENVNSIFNKALEKHLKNNMNYYDPNSVVVEDTIVTNAHIKKIITADDPETDENEEVTEEYDSQIVVAYAKASQRRDSFFLFDNTDIYYYAVDKKEFVDNSQIVGNDEINHFYHKYAEQTYKKIQPISIFILMLMLSLIIIVPILIMIFHNKARGTVGFPRNSIIEEESKSISF
ncbi:hypothetical protein [Bacillus sp. FJAT-49736]|uniref:hypothetical protein n=1 Tax=Bacillus sp. FJAT-49736 TaxID=2833582 RepID=UPI001BCA2100|nr:hypothetical protein [Bacillus sp. FJAT-49736]MBS4172791.1 hypothetical protein [Bacillus sp. FJAT-49736]